VTSATSVPVLVFLGLSFLDLSPMYATDRRQTYARRASFIATDVRHKSDAHHRLMSPTLGTGA